MTKKPGEASSSQNSQYEKVLGKGSDSLDMFMEALAKFDREFCEAMMRGHDYTLKLEIHGNKGVLVHARCSCDTFRRPPDAQRRIEKK